MREIISPQAKENPKTFWGYISSKKVDSSSIPPLRNPIDGVTYTDNQTKAEILKKKTPPIFQTYLTVLSPLCQNSLLMKEVSSNF